MSRWRDAEEMYHADLMGFVESLIALYTDWLDTLNRVSEDADSLEEVLAVLHSCADAHKAFGLGWQAIRDSYKARQEKALAAGVLDLKATAPELWEEQRVGLQRCADLATAVVAAEKRAWDATIVARWDKI